MTARPHLTLSHRSARRVGVTLLAVVALAGTAAAPASAHGKGHGHGHGSSKAPVRVAAGLDNPRQLSVGPGGLVLVAEAGRGGDGPCIPSPEGGDACLGSTGAVTALDGRGHQWRVVRGLPSLAGEGGASAIGPSDVEWTGGHKLAVLVGLGANPELRPGLGAAGARLGTLQQASLWSSRTRTLADLAAHELATNPIHDPDSNPVGLSRNGSGWVVADAGGNTVVSVSRTGRMSTIAVLDDQLAVAPPFLGLPPGTKIPAQAVPTAAVKGPDGAWYVSQLTGFPFEKGLAKIWRVKPGKTPTVYASGLTNVTSLAFGPKGRLYAVQIAKDGLLSAPEGQPPIGSVVRVTPHGSTHTTVADNLAAPYGIAVKGNRAYVSTCAVCPGGGEVWRVSL